MRQLLARTVLTVVVVVVVMAAAVAPVASAHACSSGFYGTHPQVVQKLLARAPYGTKTTLQRLFRLPVTMKAYRGVTIDKAVRLPTATGRLPTAAGAASAQLRIFLRSATSAYLNSLAWPSWIGPSSVNLVTNVHRLLVSGDINRMRAYRIALARANNEPPCIFGTQRPAN